MTNTGPIPFDRVADRYDETRGGEPRGAAIADQLAPWLHPGRVLEVGVGTGVVAASLAARGLRVAGVDLSPDMIVRAYRRLNGNVAIGDARRLPIAHSTVDNVLFVWVLHLCGDIPAAFAEAARVLRAGGRVAAVTGPGEYAPTDVELAEAPLAALRRARPDNPSAVASAAAAAGLTIVHEGHTVMPGILRTPADAARDLEGRAWSFLWSVSEDGWREHAVPVIAALKALPDQDRPRETTGRQRLTVFAKA